MISQDNLLIYIVINRVIPEKRGRLRGLLVIMYIEQENGGRDRMPRKELPFPQGTYATTAIKLGQHMENLCLNLAECMVSLEDNSVRRDGSHVTLKKQTP